MRLALICAVSLVGAHESWGGSEGFAPHVEAPDVGHPESYKNYAPNNIDNSDNYRNIDDDRRAYAPAYDDHHSYQHHPVAHKFSDEHYMDDEGTSMRVIHGQDSSKHISTRMKKKIFDVIKEAKHHFAVQRIRVPFPFHHHYYNP